MADIEALDPLADRIAQRMGEMITNQEVLDQVLADAGDDAKRAVILAHVSPYLKFKTMEEAPIGDCPKCGFRRGTILPHECL